MISSKVDPMASSIDASCYLSAGSRAPLSATIVIALPCFVRQASSPACHPKGPQGTDQLALRTRKQVAGPFVCGVHGSRQGTRVVTRQGGTVANCLVVGRPSTRSTGCITKDSPVCLSSYLGANQGVTPCDRS